MKHIIFLGFLIQTEYRYKIAIRRFLFRSEWQIFTDSVSKNPLTQTLLDLFPKFGQKLLRPYLSKKYNCLDRVQILTDHYNFLEKRGLSDLALKSAENPLVLASFRSKSGSEYGVTLQSEVEDCLEGEFTLTIWSQSRSLYRICFTFCRIEGAPTVHVGSIQGPNGDDRIELVRQATRALFGARPRDFIFRVLSQIADLVGCKKIYLISNENRICSLEKYNRKKQVFANYDHIWQDLGAKPNSLGFYEISCGEKNTDLSEIPSKKRSERRKRENLLSNISAQIRTNFNIAINNSNTRPTSYVHHKSDEHFQFETKGAEAEAI